MRHSTQYANTDSPVLTETWRVPNSLVPGTYRLAVCRVYAHPVESYYYVLTHDSIEVGGWEYDDSGHETAEQALAAAKRESQARR